MWRGTESSKMKGKSTTGFIKEKKTRFSLSFSIHLFLHFHLRSAIHPCNEINAKRTKPDNGLVQIFSEFINKRDCVLFDWSLNVVRCTMNIFNGEENTIVDTQHAKPVLNVRTEISLNKPWAVMLLIQRLMRDAAIVCCSVWDDRRLHLPWGDFHPFHICTACKEIASEREITEWENETAHVADRRHDYNKLAFRMKRKVKMRKNWCQRSHMWISFLC